MQSAPEEDFDDSVVTITAGRHKGRIAYSDCLNSANEYAVVFGQR
jgi:hypothetical protein